MDTITVRLDLLSTGVSDDFVAVGEGPEELLVEQAGDGGTLDITLP